MNQRIQELLAELDIDLYTDEGVMMTKILVRPKDLRQFAELIVRKCAQVAKEVDGDESDDYQSGRTWAGIDVLEHFGVEE